MRDASDEGPSAVNLRRELVRRIRGIESRNALLAIDAVVSLLEPPYDSELCVEAFLGVAEIAAGCRLLGEARSARRRRDEEEGEPC